MIRIFIADDHAIMRDGLKRILSDDEKIIIVGEAEDGKEAVRLLRSCDWDILLLDVSMPNMGGLEVLARVHQGYPEKKVLILTQYEECHLALRFLKAGASGYMSKQEASKKLVQAVHLLANGRRYVTPSIAEKLIDELNEEEVALHTILSNQEYNIMSRIVFGMSLSAIARELNLSVSTVSTYRRRILKKMKLDSNAALVRYALEKELFSYRVS